MGNDRQLTCALLVQLNGTRNLMAASVVYLFIFFFLPPPTYWVVTRAQGSTHIFLGMNPCCFFYGLFLFTRASSVCVCLTQQATSLSFDGTSK